MKKYFIFMVLLVLLFSIGSAYAEQIGDNSTFEIDDTSIEVDNTNLEDNNVLDNNSEILKESNIIEDGTDSSDLSTTDEPILKDSSDVIVVNTWEELRKYALKADKNYVVKLKENTNFYPSSTSSSSNQIIVKNNLKIIGSKGSYIGDSSPNAGKITYTAIVVDDNKIGITLENITFKWIATQYNPDGYFLRMAGNTINTIKNCQFENINTNRGHSCILYIKKGDALIENCTFTNCTTDFGVLSVYDPESVITCRMIVRNCYFENNYARTEPGCINNCGILSVYNTTFIKNRSFWWAGAIHTHSDANTTIYSSNFIDNVAGWNGGALYTYSWLRIYNSTFHGNNCTTDNGGGAIGACSHGSNPHVIINNCYFENNINNEQYGKGGAIAVMDNCELKVNNSIFINNNAAKGTAITASFAEGYGSPNVIITGNKFINQTRLGDVIFISIVGSGYLAENNYYSNNGIPFSDINLTVSNPIDKKVNVTINASLLNPERYDSNILDKCKYAIYIDGIYKETTNTNVFTLNFEDIETCKVYVVPSISNARSQEITVTVPREFIYVSKEKGNDLNDGLTKENPVFSLSKAIELSKFNEHILLMDGVFNEENLVVNSRLTIWGTENSSIGNSSIQNTMFEVNNAKFSLRNLTINNFKMTTEDSRFIKSISSKIIFDNSLIENNVANKFIETSDIEIKNSVLKNNNISIETGDLLIKDSSFNNNVNHENNAIINSKSDSNWQIISSNFTNNHDLTKGIFYSSTSNSFKILNSIFENNHGLTNSSCIIIDKLTNLNIMSSVFLNNEINLPIIYKNSLNSLVNISNSIILNNTKNNGIVGGELKNVECNYNWWGNTNENLTLNSPMQIDNWLFLNMTYTKFVEFDKDYIITLSLDNLITKDSTVSVYGKYNLPKIIFSLNKNNINTNKNLFTISNGKDEIIYSLIDVADGNLSTIYEFIIVNTTFNFIKTNPMRNITYSNILLDNDENIKVTLPIDATGNITISFLNFTETKLLTNSKASFNIKNLGVDNYTVLVLYSGNNKYMSFEDSINFTVSKHESNIKISMTEIIVNQDLTLTFEVNDDATGNITIYVNGAEKNLILDNSKCNYTINNITRGDWIVKAIYNGDFKYNPSENNTKFGVAKYDANVMINLLDIIYGEDAEVQIFMNNDATGNVTVIIDEKNKTDTIINGKAKFIISNLTAGYKNVYIHYTGDANYNEKTYSSIFYVEKKSIDFNISSNNAKEGKNVVIYLGIQEGVKGNFTINIDDIVDVIEIPPSGEITWNVNNLPLGNFTCYVTYNGQNYKTYKKSVQITVYPWETTPWPNEGYDEKNNGKSPYDSNVNGEILWILENLGNTNGNLAIDSEQNIYVITSSGLFSYDKNGNPRWNYSLKSESKFSGICIGREVVILPISGDTLYFFNQTSGQRIGSIYQGSSIFSPIVDKKANIYITGEQIYESKEYNLVIIPYSFWGTGGEFTSINIGKSSPTTAPVVVNENIVCVGTQEGLKIIDISQEKVILNLNIITSIRPVVGDGGIIYTLTQNEIIAIDSIGNELWKSNINGGEAKYLAIDNENGLLYSINKQGNLYKYDILNSDVETLVFDLNITSGLLIGNDGTVYVGANSTLMALDSNGKYLWKSNLGKTITGMPVMDKDGNIYVTGNTTLFAITNAPLKDSTLNINASNVVYGNDVNIQVNLDNEATGEVIIKINGQTYSSEVNDGLVELSIPNLASGSYETNITYVGDKRYSTSQKTLPVNVTKAETPASDINIPAEISATNPSFSINLPSDATGTLTVTVDGVKYSSELKDGSATVNVPKLSSGKHNIIVTYSGDENYHSITNRKTVTVPSPKITGNKNVVMDYNDGSVYKVRVFGSDGKIIKGELVIFTINKKTTKVKTDNDGYASVKIAEIPKKYTITATYKETTVKNTVTVKQILKSSNFKVKKSAKKLVLKATLKSSKGKTIKGEQIKFKFNGKTYKAKTNKKGIVKVTIKKNVIKKLKVKKYALQITYLKVTLKKTVTVKK